LRRKTPRARDRQYVDPKLLSVIVRSCLGGGSIATAIPNVRQNPALSYSISGHRCESSTVSLARFRFTKARSQSIRFQLVLPTAFWTRPMGKERRSERQVSRLRTPC